MENPFPGMNPYLEPYWRDIHHRVVTYACDQLASRLPRDLRARIDERVAVTADEFERDIYPDVRVVERKNFGGQVAELETSVVTVEPVVVRVTCELPRQGFIRIVEAGSGERVITVIEFLSLSNKTGEGREQYVQKQRECVDAHISLVEIDLLRGGKRSCAIPEGRVPRQCRTPYRVCVVRGWEPSSFELYPVPLQRRLPAIRIPLRRKDDDVRLDLQPLIDQAYRNGMCDDVDYKRNPLPPLDDQDAAWADALLKEKALR